jgi:hypothetical protein
MTDKGLIFSNRSIDVHTKFAWVRWLAHGNSKPIIVIKLLTNKVDTLESAEHVIYRDKATPVLPKLSL